MSRARSLTETASPRCEAIRLQSKWTQERCKRNATVVVHGFLLCEQHAKIHQGMPADVRLTAPGQPL